MLSIDTLASGEPAAWPSTTQLMGDRSGVLRKLRDVSLSDDVALTANERQHVPKLANSSQHVFLLVAQLAHEYRQVSGIDEAFLDNAQLEEAVGVSAGCPDDEWVAHAAAGWQLEADGLPRRQAPCRRRRRHPGSAAFQDESLTGNFPFLLHEAPGHPFGRHYFCSLPCYISWAEPARRPFSRAEEREPPGFLDGRQAAAGPRPSRVS